MKQETNTCIIHPNTSSLSAKVSTESAFTKSNDLTFILHTAYCYTSVFVIHNYAVLPNQHTSNNYYTIRLVSLITDNTMPCDKYWYGQ